MLQKGTLTFYGKSLLGGGGGRGASLWLVRGIGGLPTSPVTSVGSPVTPGGSFRATPPSAPRAP